MNDLIICPYCGGDGYIDSGGQAPWGSWINIPCPACNGHRKLTQKEYDEFVNLSNMTPL